MPLTQASSETPGPNTQRFSATSDTWIECDVAARWNKLSGYTEEIWILDAEGTRLMIAAGRSPGSPAQDVEELRTILDSIQIDV